MTTRNEFNYLVAYPHPSVTPLYRVKRFNLDQSKTDVETLLGLLKNSYPDHTDDLNDAILRKVNGLSWTVIIKDDPEDVYNWIRNDDPGIVALPFLFLGDIFPGGPHERLNKEVDILVMTPEITEAMEFQRDVDGNLRHMKSRVTLSKTMRMTRSPSESVKNLASIKSAVEDPSGPRFGRPSDRFGPPTVLFSRELALLKYDLDHLGAFMPDYICVGHAHSLIENATNFFNNEGERETVLLPILRRLLVGNSDWRVRILDGSDGGWLEEFFAYPIIDMKDEQGLGGDPFLRGLVVYGKALAHEKCRQFLGRSNLPVLLLAIVGNRLTLSTAIFTDSVYSDELLSIKLYFGSHASDNVLRIARVFMAINKCVDRLRELYGDLGTSTHPTPPARVLWPNPTTDPPGSTEVTQGLEFFCKVDRFLGTPINRTVIDEENRQHAMYLARVKTEDGASTTEVLVKFAVKYNEAAHRLLADHKPPLAPTLHSCTRVIGDMFMVVMQYVPGVPLLDVLLPLPAATHEAVRRDVSEALELLHGQDLVFGDLREANILYLPEDGGRAMLVDFDGVGRDGEDRYSACLNLGLRFGVARLQIMEKSHDVKNFTRLMERLSEEL